MSHCIVPNWNPRHLRQEQVEGEESNRSSHVHNQLQNPTTQLAVHMSNYHFAELTWENGQPVLHELGGLPHVVPTEPMWDRTNETLESIVHQATCQKQNLNLHHKHQTPANISSIVASSDGKHADSSSSHRVQVVPLLMKKPDQSESNGCTRNFNGSFQDDNVDGSACARASASASATFSTHNDTTTTTWTSFESPQSLKTKAIEEDSACHGGSENHDEDRETKNETVRTQTSRRSRAAAVHNQSERRRRNKINQKMKTLQKLVPNSSKTDKASMLGEVIEYMKQLQAQVQIMSAARSLPHMIMPLGMQQHFNRMSLLARMGMGVGLGMGMGTLDMSNVPRSSLLSVSPLIHPAPVTAATPTFVSPPFLVPSMIPTNSVAARAKANEDPGTSSSVRLPDPYSTFSTQSMNMDLYNKMAALYGQQLNQISQETSSPIQSKSGDGQGD